MPEIKAGKNVLIAAHGNSLRGIVKHLEGESTHNIPLNIHMHIGQAASLTTRLSHSQMILHLIIVPAHTQRKRPQARFLLQLRPFCRKVLHSPSAKLLSAVPAGKMGSGMVRSRVGRAALKMSSDTITNYLLNKVVSNLMELS